jgi:uncharacterized protein (DUF3084 family)
MQNILEVVVGFILGVVVSAAAFFLATIHIRSGISELQDLRKAYQKELERLDRERWEILGKLIEYDKINLQDPELEKHLKEVQAKYQSIEARYELLKRVLKIFNLE